MMTQAEIFTYVESSIFKVLDGSSVQNNKICCKCQWPDSTDAVSINEFMKECCAIVKSFGPEGFLVKRLS